MLKFYSQANQDEFVYNILKKKTDGIFVDIGSNDPMYWNNSFFLESIGWNGISIDKEKYDYSQRKCKFYVQDALEINYENIFKENNLPSVIDYLSLDIDYYTLDCLKKIPLDKYRFKTITIEHDHYRFHDLLRFEQREILLKHGYYLLCSDITCLPLTPDQYFEDWWIDRNQIDENLVDLIKSDKELCSSIVKKFDCYLDPNERDKFHS